MATGVLEILRKLVGQEKQAKETAQDVAYNLKTLAPSALRSIT